MFVHKKSVLLFLFPGVMLLMIFSVFPFLNGIRYSVTDGSRAMSFVGLENYHRLWQNSMFLMGLKNTLILSAICAPLLWLLSLSLSLGLQTIAPHGRLFRSAVLLPYLLPSSALLLIWKIMFDYGGPVNRLLVVIGIERIQWLQSSALRFPIVIIFLWRNLGFCTVVFVAALQAVPDELYEYALLEGAGFLTRTFRIALPQILPTAFLVLIFSWINAFKIFQEAYIIAGAYPDNSIYTLQHYMNNMFSRLDFQMVTAAAYSFATIVLLLFTALFLIQRKAMTVDQ